MKVYVVVEETNEPMNGEADACVVAVFATRELADADVAAREQQARRTGLLPSGDDDDRWDLAWSIEEYDVQGLTPGAPGTSVLSASR